MTTDVLIKVENLQKYFKGDMIKALDGVSTEIHKGEVVVVSVPPAPANPPSCAA